LSKIQFTSRIRSSAAPGGEGRDLESLPSMNKKTELAAELRKES
jgi:hypothetical protein